MDELRSLFGAFASKAKTAVLNLDNGETKALAAGLPAESVSTYSVANRGASLFADRVDLSADGATFEVSDFETGEYAAVRLQMPGAHNVSNALAALCAVRAGGIFLGDAAQAIAGFTGIKRRFERVGAVNGVTVIDDFAHNPDKIAATLATLHAFPGRLLLMFQPHGFGPLKLMKDELIECFAENRRAGDVLVMPEPVYYGGTVKREVTSEDIIRGIVAKGGTAYAFPSRKDCGDKLISIARPGDRIVVMGARDDTLSEFADELLRRLA